MNKIVLIDGNNIAHIVFHSAQNIARKQSIAEDDRPGWLYRMTQHMFLNKLFSILNKWPDANYYIAWDAKNATAWRRGQIDSYKSNRVASDDVKQSLYSAIDSLREILPAFPIYQYYQEGFEADDIIYHIVASSPNHDFVVVSNDQDMQQIAQRYNSTIIWNPKKNEVVDAPSGYDITVKKALVGDKSDNIPGISGIGDKGGEKIARAVYQEEITRQLMSNYLSPENVEMFLSYLEIIDIARNPNLNNIHIDWDELYKTEKRIDEQKILAYFRTHHMKSHMGKWKSTKRKLNVE